MCTAIPAGKDGLIVVVLVINFDFTIKFAFPLSWIPSYLKTIIRETSVTSIQMSYVYLYFHKPMIFMVRVQITCLFFQIDIKSYYCDCEKNKQVERVGERLIINSKHCRIYHSA